jgi:2-oxoisovalerate dehydrogenase E2 component (dihydrolipoyl transacylase)
VSVSIVSAAGRTFMLPDLGEGLTEAEVIEWHVAPGDEVSVDQIVVTVETAKATVDLPCPYAGCVLTLHSAPGAVLVVGRPLLTIGAEERSGSGNVLVGYGTSEAKRSGRRRVTPGRPAAAGITADAAGSAAARPTTKAPTVPAPSVAAASFAAPSVAAGSVAAPSAATPAVATPAAETPSAPVSAFKVISPVVRKLARDNKINLAGVAPTGLGGVIRRSDVEAALRIGPAGLQIGTTGLPSADLAPARGAVRADRAGDIRIPLRGIRRAIAEKMTTSRREIPEVTTWVDVDATGLMAAKDQMKAASPTAGIGLLALFARISVAGLTKFPELNARVDLEAQEIVQLGDVNLSFAAQSPRGLVVPVVHGAGAMTTTELAAALRELTGLARDGKLTPAQMTGGTFTLNNYGVFGTDGATPIINYPEAAMLGVGRIIDRPWAHAGQIALRKVAQLGLTFDHRVCDGATAGGFLRFVADCVENPTLLLAEL